MNSNCDTWICMKTKYFQTVKLVKRVCEVSAWSVYIEREVCMVRNKKVNSFIFIIHMIYQDIPPPKKK